MIRKARPSDCMNLATLSLQVWLSTYATQGIRDKISRYALATFTEQSFDELLSKPQCETLVYIKDEHLVGFITVDLSSTFGGDNNGYEITTLYISDHFQGQGIGRKLLNEIKARYGSSFWLSTWIKNEGAINFYRHLGFTVIGDLNFDLDGELHENYVLAYHYESSYVDSPD